MSRRLLGAIIGGVPGAIMGSAIDRTSQRRRIEQPMKRWRVFAVIETEVLGASEKLVREAFTKRGMDVRSVEEIPGREEETT